MFQTVPEDDCKQALSGESVVSNSMEPTLLPQKNKECEDSNGDDDGDEDDDEDDDPQKEIDIDIACEEERYEFEMIF